MFAVKQEMTPAVATAAHAPIMPVHELQSKLIGELCLPGSEAYEQARKAWIVTVDQHPALIVVALNANDVAEAVRYARAQGYTVAVQATGHGGIQVTEGTLLIVTAKMNNAHINSEQRTAYVEAGAKWDIVLQKAQAFGLAPLLGSTGDVGAIGYTLGGGMGWLARKHGFSADSVNAFDVVTAAGELMRASATEHSDLFWALRGGGASFAIVTGMEIKLYPVTQVYAGNLLYPISMAREVMQRWREYTRHAPDALTTAVVLMNFPPIPDVPEPLRGQSFVMVRGCYADDTLEYGYIWVQSWRDWRKPVFDFWNVMPFTQADSISQDPKDPLPAWASGAWLNALSDDAIDALIESASPQNDQPPVLLFNEVRLAGGAISRVPEDASLIGHRDAKYVLNSVGLTMTPEMAQTLAVTSAQLRQRLAPVLAGVYQNFVDGAERQRAASKIFSTAALHRLAGIKAKYDPGNLLRHGVKLG